MEMKKEMSLNLCELFNVLYKEYGSVDEIVKKSGIATESNFARIYIGSYFCEVYFIQSMETTLANIERYALDNRMRITLVIPIFTQSHLQKGLQIINTILDKFSLIDEVVVNDYGILNYINLNYNIEIIIGRLLRKRARDYRYPEYIKSKEYAETKELYRKYARVKGVEIDVTSQEIELSDFALLYLPCIHMPFTYLTCGQLCDFASLDLDIFQKFNSNNECNLNCNKLYYIYRTETEHNLYRIGKAVYYETPKNQILKGDKVRVVYFPFDLWEKNYEYFGSDK